MKAFPSAEQLILTYGLEPHPEGGYFKETYRSGEQVARSVLPPRFGGDRSFSTAIYYLLTTGSKSRFHRIASDEIWHFYLGGPLVLVEIQPEGTLKRTILGAGVDAGQVVQHMVRAGSWFGAYPFEGTEYSFVGCTVAPGFEFADFEMAKRSQLLAQFPQIRAEIEQLTDP